VSATVLYVGEPAGAPALDLPEAPGWTWNERAIGGSPVEVILDTAKTEAADLIVMTTAGHQGFLDALRGSTTERVLRSAPCPLLAVPAS
jgi:nucleotide-binding universal stress UspA family protein